MGQAGMHLLLSPRATPHESVDKWLAGGRAAAVASGAYCLSSNHYRAPGGAANLGGGGFVCDPEGEVLACTTPDAPFATVEVDLAFAEASKKTYPRYVMD
jgi:N-carbamoylputrescine amidase